MFYKKMTFNLVDKPFLPCVTRTGQSVMLSISEFFAAADELVSLTGDSPIQTAALWRFLMAVLYSILSLTEVADWEKLAAAGQLPNGDILTYLNTWRERFDLFHPERPFYQTPGLEKYFVPIQKLYPERAAGNNDTLFDHTHKGSGFWVDAATAARGVITAQAFSVGGLVSFERKEDRSAQAGALAAAMVIQVAGRTCFEVLLRNLTRYRPASDEPFPCRNGDRPAWERDLCQRPQDRIPDGLRDYLTFQSRRLLLHPHPTAGGEIRCDQVAILKGDQFDPEWSHRNRDPYVAFRRFDAATNARDQWLPLRLDPERAVWRDSGALFSPADNNGSTQRPRHFTWLARLREVPGFEAARFEITAFGQATDQATILMWRAERLTLPAVFLDQPVYSEELRRALESAENTARLLRQAVQKTLEQLGLKSPKATPHLAQAQTLYWSRLEPSYRRFVEDLAAIPANDDGSFEGREVQVLEDWKKAVARSGRDAFANFGDGLSSSARTLKALAEGERIFRPRGKSQEGVATGALNA